MLQVKKNAWERWDSAGVSWRRTSYRNESLVYETADVTHPGEISGLLTCISIATQWELL